MRDHLRVAPFGLLLGVAISRLGFTDYRQMHRMFTFADWRMLMAFVGAVLLSMVGMRLVARGRHLPANPIHKGTVPGGLLFGAGWALTGSCPAVPLAQLGEGKLPAFAALAGVLAGILVYGPVHARFFRFDRGSCGR